MKNVDKTKKHILKVPVYSPKKLPSLPYFEASNVYCRPRGLICTPKEDKSKNNFQVMSITPIPYKELRNRISNYKLAHIQQEFDAESAVVWRIGYKIKGKLKHIVISTAFDMALSSSLVQPDKSYDKLIQGVPLLSDKEFSVILDLYAARETKNLLSEPEKIYERINERKYNDRIRKRIFQFLPDNLIEEKENLEKAVREEIEKLQPAIISSIRIAKKKLLRISA